MDYIFLDNTESTNTVLLEGDYPPGTAVVTTNQTSGRGRSGRVWKSEPGQSLALSLQLSCMDSRALMGAQIVAGFAVAEALLPWGDIRLKWPNDLVYAGKKLGGMIIETRFSGNRMVKAVYGVGINLSGVPKGFEQRAISLSDIYGDPVDSKEVIESCLGSLDEKLRLYLHDGIDIPMEWPMYSANYMKKITLHLNGEMREVTELGITREGWLIARDLTGNNSVYTEGEIGYNFTL